MTEWDPARLRGLVAEVATRVDAHELLSERDCRQVIRVHQDGGSVVIKFWARPGLRGTIRRRLGRTIAVREYQGLQTLARLGVRVPTPHGFALVGPNPAGFSEAVVMSDLGQVDDATEHFKALVRAGDDAPIRAFEDDLIEITTRMWRGRVLDYDHGLINMVVPASGRPVRLDLEHARVHPLPRLRPDLRTRMLGHLLLTHLFAVQPASHWTESFSQRLLAAVPVNRAIQRGIESYVRRRLARQRAHIDFDVSFTLPRS